MAVKIFAVLLVVASLLAGCLNSPDKDDVPAPIYASGTLIDAYRSNPNAIYFRVSIARVPMGTGEPFRMPSRVQVFISSAASGAPWIEPMYYVTPSTNAGFYTLEVRIMDAGYIGWHYHIVADFE